MYTYVGFHVKLCRDKPNTICSSCVARINANGRDLQPVISGFMCTLYKNICAISAVRPRHHVERP